MKHFETPTIELVAFETEDVITISGLLLMPPHSKPYVFDYGSISSIFLGL